MNIEVNNISVEANNGETILDVLKRNNIHVPTLCHIKDMLPSGACRICIVEDIKTGKLIPSCSFPAYDGLKIKTHSYKVINARKTIVELLLANHPNDCLYCDRNQNCDLQTLASDLQIKQPRIKGQKEHHNLDFSSVSLKRDPDKCILCGRCVRVCETIMGVSAISFINRGSRTFIGTALNEGLNTSSCINCGRCVVVCPTGALSEQTQYEKVIEAINNSEKTVVVQYAPAISVSLAEFFDIEAGTDVNGKMNAALRRLGFDKVFDTTFSADLTIMEEGTELINRLQNGGKLPMFTSCCPAWIKYAEEFLPDMLDNISTCKSPQQMLGAIIKTYFAEKIGTKPENIYSVSIMPCIAKKFEEQRVEMGRESIADIDAVLTTRELAELIKTYGIDFKNLEPESADSPHGERSTAGKLFGVSGGVMEAAIRTAYAKLTGNELEDLKVEAVRGLEGRKEAKLNINGFELGVAVVSGLANAIQLIDEIKKGRSDIHFVEIMACPGGCINGGGQKLHSDIEDIKKRMQSLYIIDIDENEPLKVSHKNKEVLDLYEKFLGEPNSHKAHELLHTKYHKRDVLL